MKFEKLKKMLEEGNGFDDCGLKILGYIPIQSKCESITDEMLDTVVEIVDGHMVIHKFNYELYCVALLAKFYCGIEFDKGITSDDYDFLWEHKFGVWLKDTTKGDSILFINKFLNFELDNKINRFNSFGASFQRVDKEGMLHVNKLGESLQQLKDIDPENMKVFDMLGKMNNDKKEV